MSRPNAWNSEHVAAAIVAAIAAVLVAAIGLLGQEDDDSETSEPKISIGDFVFFPQPNGDVKIQVTGTVADFPPEDRIYAVAEPTPIVKPIWWVSQRVAPTLDGTWVAEILASAAPGQEVRVYAVRVPNTGPGPTLGTDPPIESQTPGPTKTPGPLPVPTSTTHPTVTATQDATRSDRTRAVLEERGPDAVGIDLTSRTITIPIP
jgi:hypothetical protein